MPKFCTYTTNADEDPRAISGDAYDAGYRLPEDWSDYIWQDAESEAEAVSMHERRHDEYMKGLPAAVLK